ncbi:MAG: HPr family phosphocarrier protein [Oceanobacter sp.]|jgi:phosphocarrier protein
MTRIEIQIINKLGLHARAAAKFVATASSFAATIQVGHSGRMVDGKSIMAVMMLAASKGTELTIEASGDDEASALEALTDLIQRRFDEEE